MIHLGTVHLITDRPGAAPAPTPPSQPTPPLPPASPWQPRTTSLLDAADRDNAAKLGRLDFLISEMQHIAGRDGCPPDLADLIAQARQVTGQAA